MTYTPVTEIKVGLNFTDETIPVGRLATRDHKIYFEYDPEFLKFRATNFTVLPSP